MDRKHHPVSEKIAVIFGGQSQFSQQFYITGPADLHTALAEYYAGDRFITVAAAEETAADAVQLDPQDLNGTNVMRLHVFGNAAREQAVVTAVLDNLGKGAAGQAIQNLNLMLGLDEAVGL